MWYNQYFTTLPQVVKNLKVCWHKIFVFEFYWISHSLTTATNNTNTVRNCNLIFFPKTFEFCEIVINKKRFFSNHTAKWNTHTWEFYSKHRLQYLSKHESMQLKESHSFPIVYHSEDDLTKFRIKRLLILPY